MTEEITKKRVTMKTVGQDGAGNLVWVEMSDFIREDFLDAYVKTARERFQSVVVSDDYDAGPAGYHGATSVPADIDHPLAGQVFEATQPSDQEVDK